MATTRQKEKRVTVRQQKVIEELTRVQYNRLIQHVRQAATKEGFKQLPAFPLQPYHKPMATVYPGKYRTKYKRLMAQIKEFDEGIEADNEKRAEESRKIMEVAEKLIKKLETERDEKVIAIAFIDASPEVRQILEDLPDAGYVMKEAKKIGLALDQKKLPATSDIGAYSPTMKTLLGDEKE